MADSDVIAEELSSIGKRLNLLHRRVADAERVNAQMQDAALTMARALNDVSRHWDAVYEAMRRGETVVSESSSERDNAASRARRQGGAVPPDPPGH